MAHGPLVLTSPFKCCDVIIASILCVDCFEMVSSLNDVAHGPSVELFRR